MDLVNRKVEQVYIGTNDSLWPGKTMRTELATSNIIIYHNYSTY